MFKESLESQGEAQKGTDLQFDGGKNPRRAVNEEGEGGGV